MVMRLMKQQSPKRVSLASRECIGAMGVCGERRVLSVSLFSTAFLVAVCVLSLLFLPGVPATAQATKPIPDWKCPVSGYVHTTSISDWGAYRPSGGWHKGHDIFGRAGRSLVAVENGVVSGFLDSVGGWSAFLRADSGNMYYYTHLHVDPRIDPANDWPTQPGGTKGGWIVAGARVGSMGNSGNADNTPVHLHFEFRLGSSRNYVNPIPYVARYCV